MRKNLFILLIVLFMLLAMSTHALAQEAKNFTSSPVVVQEEQKLMVTIRMEIAEGGAVHVKNLYGFALYPQTVITALDPMLVLGARTTIIYQKEITPAVRANLNLRLGLAILLLVKPLAVDTQKNELFSEKNSDENTFVLTPQFIKNIKDLTEKEIGENCLRGALAVDGRGTLLGIVSCIEKNAHGAPKPLMIPFDFVGVFIEDIKQEPPIPQFSLPEDLEPGETNEKSVNLNTIQPPFNSRNDSAAFVFI